jgi:hypothetical protein
VPLVRQVPLPSIGRLTRFKATKKRAPITIFQARAGGQDAGRRRHSCRCSRDRAWLPLPRVFGLKGHSLIYDTGEAVAAQALFLEHGDTGGASAPAPPTARPISAASRAIARCPAAPRRSPPIRAPSTSCRRSRRMSRRSLSEAGSRAAGPLPAGAPRRPAADRRLTGRRARLHRNRAQRLGYPERARDRRGSGRAHFGREDHGGRSVAVPPGPAAGRSSGIRRVVIASARVRRQRTGTSEQRTPASAPYGQCRYTAANGGCPPSASTDPLSWGRLCVRLGPEGESPET